VPNLLKIVQDRSQVSGKRKTGFQSRDEKFPVGGKIKNRRVRREN